MAIYYLWRPSVLSAWRRFHQAWGLYMFVYVLISCGAHPSCRLGDVSIRFGWLLYAYTYCLWRPSVHRHGDNHPTYLWVAPICLVSLETFPPTLSYLREWRPSVLSAWRRFHYHFLPMYMFMYVYLCYVVFMYFVGAHLSC